MTRSTIVRARWILPIDRPAIERGWVEVRDHRIARVGDGPPPADAQDLGNAVLLPGLVNAHVHLEWSWLHGKIAPTACFTDWVRAIIARRHDVRVGADQREAAMRRAAEEMRRTGTIAVGDVSNTLTSIPVLRSSRLAGVVFHELIGFDPVDPVALVDDAWMRVGAAFGAVTAEDATRLRAVVVAHAPYSVSPALFSAIASRHPGGALPVHLAESAEEGELLESATGPFKQLLEDLGVWRDSWRPPGPDAVGYMAALGYLQPGFLAVHGVHLPVPALERLRDRGGAVVTCPRSNVWVGAGVPPIARFYAAGVPVAVGTDSLASVASLNLFDELAELRRLAPEVTAASFLESATRVGADRLGLGHDHGVIAPGRRADLVCVQVPDGITDVEEYLVSGVPDSAVRLLEL